MGGQDAVEWLLSNNYKRLETIISDLLAKIDKLD
jgi:hypothetical protein